MGLMRSTKVRPFYYFEEAIAGSALIVLVVTVCWGVLTRYITATSAAWTGDVTSVAFAWLIFMGSAAAFKYGMHMSIDLFWSLIPPLLRRYIGMVVNLTVLAFLAYGTWLGAEFCLASIDDPLPILRWSRSVLYSAVMTGFGCMFLRYAEIAWRNFHGDATPTHSLAEVREEEDAGWV